jgi:type II secretion system protein N
MGQLFALIKKALSWAFANKWKFVLMIISAIVFAVLIFPFDDLGDLVSTQVSQATRNQVFVQFDRMNLSLFPAPGVAMDGVFLEARNFPPLKAEELIVSPSLTSLITQKPAGSLVAHGFLKGDIHASLQPAGKSEGGAQRQKIVVQAKSLSLSELHDLLRMPVAIQGQLSLNAQALADLSFATQPDADIDIRIDKFELPTSNVQTAMGPITLPQLKLSSVELKGKLAGGKLQIENGQFGRAGDEVHGNIKGSLDLQIRNMGVIVPVVGGYHFEISLDMKKSFQDRAALFLSFVDQFKTPTAEGAHYGFQLSAINSMIPPSISALR